MLSSGSSWDFYFPQLVVTWVLHTQQSSQLETFLKQIKTPVSAQTLPHFAAGVIATLQQTVLISATLWPSSHAISSTMAPLTYPPSHPAL